MDLKTKVLDDLLPLLPVPRREEWHANAAVLETLCTRCGRRPPATRSVNAQERVCTPGRVEYAI